MCVNLVLLLLLFDSLIKTRKKSLSKAQSKSCHVLTEAQELKLICLQSSQKSMSTFIILSFFLNLNSILLHTRNSSEVTHVERVCCSVLPNWHCQASLRWLVSQSDRITQSTWREAWETAWAQWKKKRRRNEKGCRLGGSEVLKDDQLPSRRQAVLSFIHK